MAPQRLRYSGLELSALYLPIARTPTKLRACQAGVNFCKQANWTGDTGSICYHRDSLLLPLDSISNTIVDFCEKSTYNQTVSILPFILAIYIHLTTVCMLTGHSVVKPGSIASKSCVSWFLCNFDTKIASEIWSHPQLNSKFSRFWDIWDFLRFFQDFFTTFTLVCSKMDCKHCLC